MTQKSNSFKRILEKPIGAGLFLALVMAILSLIALFVPLNWPGAYTLLKVLLQWISLPLAGAFTACIWARSGVTNYLAWLPPPVIVSVIPWAIIGYPFAPGVMLLCAFLSMIGASAGEVLRKRADKK